MHRVLQNMGIDVPPAATLGITARRMLLKAGYGIHRLRRGCELGQYPFHDMVKLTTETIKPVVFDVGANLGQSIDAFRAHFGSPLIHAFEPGSRAFLELTARNFKKGVQLNNIGLGCSHGVKTFLEHEESDMSSFLETGEDGWSVVADRHPVEVSTVDEYCANATISKIDILKTDTQGFDLEVIKGARTMLTNHRLHLVFMEIMFDRAYKQVPRVDEVLRFMLDSGLLLVSFYATYFESDRASWTDALFIDPLYDTNGDT